MTRGRRNTSYTTYMTYKTYVLGLLIAAAAPTLGQPPPEKPAETAKPPEPITAIVGGDVWTVTKGIIKGGTVIIKGAKIDKVGGPELTAPEGAKVFDARGKVVAPGFVVPGAAGGGFGGSILRGGAGSRIKDSLDPYSLP